LDVFYFLAHYLLSFHLLEMETLSSLIKRLNNWTFHS
jgi:hypothetical protein